MQALSVFFESENEIVNSIHKRLHSQKYFSEFSQINSICGINAFRNTLFP